MLPLYFNKSLDEEVKEAAECNNEQDRCAEQQKACHEKLELGITLVFWDSEVFEG